jgi:hypothetical protein
VDLLSYFEQLPTQWLVTINLASIFILLAGVIASLTLGVKAVRRTRKMQFAEYKRRVFDETQKWACEVGTILLRHGGPISEDLIRSQMKTQAEGPRSYLATRYRQMESEFAPLRVRSVYIKEFVRNERALRQTVEALMENLKRESRLINSYMYNVQEIERKKGLGKATFNLANNERKLYDSVVDLTKIIGGVESSM